MRYGLKKNTTLGDGVLRIDVRKFVRRCICLAHIAAAGVCIAVLSGAGVCYAQDGCQSLNENPEWMGGLQDVISEIQANDYQAALKKSKRLSEICPNAPTLNYMQGKIYENLNDKSNALYYYQKASENTYNFAVDPDTAKKIWYARYEFEHPERTQGEVSRKDERIGALEAESQQNLSNFEAYKEEQYASVRKTMWAGAGVGIGGLALAGAGLGILFSQENNITIDYKTNDDIKEEMKNVKYTGPYIASWGLIGAGAALAVAGAVLTGIYGYKYTHFDKNVSYSFGVSPVKASFVIQF